MTQELVLSEEHRDDKYGIFQRIYFSYTQDKLSWIVIGLIILFFTIFLVMPLLLILVNAVYVKGNFTFETYKLIFQNKYFFDPTGSQSEYFIRIDHKENVSIYMIRGPNMGVFLNTLVIGILTTILSLIIGTLTAFLMARVDFKGKTILSGLLLIPLVLPPFVSGIGFMAVLGRGGIINDHVLAPLFHFEIVLEGIVAITLVQSLHYFTLIYLNVYSSLMNNDPSLEESAENLGASKLEVARTVTLPLAMPGIASGSILVLILSMEDVGTPMIFAGFSDPIAKQTITFYIIKHIYEGAESSNIAQESAILGAFLLLFALVGFFMIRKYVSLKQYSMVSKGRAGEFRTITPSKLITGLIYFYFAGLLITALIPHIGLILAASVAPGKFPLDFTFENYKLLFDVTNGFGRFVKNTLVFSGIATILIIIVSTLAGYIANRKKFFGQTAFDTLVTIPIAIPGIVLGIGLIKLFGDTGAIYIGNFPLTLNPITYPPILLVISYTIRKSPFTTRAVYAGLQQTDEVMEEAAINLGASKQRVIGEIIVPMITLSIIAGALVSLIYNMGEVSTTLVLISDNSYGTLTWKMADENGKVAELAAIGVFLMVLQAISLFVTNVLLRNRADALTGI